MFPSTLLPGGSPFPTIFFPSYRKPPHVRFKIHSHPGPLLLTSSSSAPPLPNSSVYLDSLRVLEWDKVCDCVSTFAGTRLGREATKEKLWSLNVCYEDSKRLLAETAAAVEMLKFGAGGMDFNGIDVVMVKSAIERALRGFPVNGAEAVAVANLIQSAETLQTGLKAAVREDADSHRFMPLTEIIIEMVINRPFVNMVHQVIDEEGCVKDSASSELKRFREKVRMLEKKLYQLMDKLIRNDVNGSSSLEVNIISGRWCIKAVSDQFTELEGLLLSSGSGSESVVEPLVAVPLNDELQQARSLAAKAEEDVLSKLTDKMLTEVADIQKLLDSIIELDVVIARAKYSLAYGGTFPDLLVSGDKDGLPITETNFSENRISNRYSDSSLNQKKWKFYLRKAYHPLLLQQHQEKLKRAKKDVSTATSEIRRARSLGKFMTSRESMELHLASSKMTVAKMEEEHPIPIDFLVSLKTNLLVITGPNTGGKTISLKTIGLASLMAKSGLYVLASEPVQIPWFDAIFADIGDEQSLSQSLSTFSGHLRQISAILSKSTSKSLVLLDEVGAGTNPLEGAALGMSLLESFAENALFTIATTHHGELKTLKYSNDLFENACVEFDELNLKPTYKILWGVPGRSNAINIAQRLGLPENILDNARKLYGTASAEINEVIIDMEKSKQDFQHYLQEAQHYITLSRKHYENLLVSKQRISEHCAMLRTRKTQAILDSAAIARSVLRNMLRQSHEATQYEKETETGSVECLSQEPSASIQAADTKLTTMNQANEQRAKIPKVGDMVHVSSLGKKAMVLKIEASKGDVIVQANNLKLRLKLSDVKS